MFLFPIAVLLLTPQITNAPANTPPPFDPRPAIQSAIHALDESAPDHTRYTYHKREHVITQGPNGRTVYDVTHTYDVTWINDKPYWRLIALNDQPLSDKDQQNEQKLYDKALKKNKDLGEEKRASMADITVIKNDADLNMVLTPAYAFTEKASETNAAGLTEHLIEADLVPKAKVKSNCKYRFRFWITQPDNVVRKYIADVPDSKSWPCANAREQAIFTVVDGVTKPSHYTSRFFPEPESGDTSIADDIYTDYRWFGTSDSIGPATVTKPAKPGNPSESTSPARPAKDQPGADSPPPAK